MNGKMKVQSNVSMLCLIVILLIVKPVFSQNSTGHLETAKIKLSFGNSSPTSSLKTVQLIEASPGLEVSNVTGKGIEKNDKVGTLSVLDCGGGDIDELIADVSWPPPSAPLRKVFGWHDGNGMWKYLLENGSRGQVVRLKEDSWNKPDAPLLTVQLNKEGTQGFTISLEQLISHGAMWLPEQDVFITLADHPVGFKKDIASLKGERTLDGVAKQPDASLKAFNKLWPDIGNPLEWNVPWQTKYMGTTGHLTVVTAAYGSIYKFAIDRWSNVRPDFASPHKFRLDLNWPGSQWKRQRIINGLPVIITNLEKNRQLAEVEQFAAPLADLSVTIRGYIPSVMFTKVRLSGKSGPFSFGISLHNELKDHQVEAIPIKDSWAIADKQTHDIFLLLETGKGVTVTAGNAIANANGQQIELTISGTLLEGEIREFVAKLPSPAIVPAEITRLSQLDFVSSEKKTTNYWEQWIKKGSQFEVPETAVNELFRANIWHALTLPRHTLDIDGKDHMDLPYANTAYGQRNADWPVNQAVYVDYMIYGLRGYDEVARDEYAAMFKSQQQPDGRIGGFANWGVYSPGQLYAIAQNFLLSGNKEQFGKLLPNSLKTLDWCLAQVAKANTATNNTGLILAPLNDLTNEEREWAFTQAYYVGGLELFAKALSAFQHPRANEVREIAAKMKIAVVKAFAGSSVKSPVVQLADGTWINFVPTDAMTPRRMLDQWYPTDVDCGALHLSRLGVIDPNSWLTTAMLQDSEDNLFLKNQGAANEPVYVQQATAYLLRDEPKAVIRAFYSLMACGFSHEQFTSLEHRWAWGQYYGPPSTDGAWFEIYRRMLINEWGDDTLIIGQAIPRKWLEKGKKIEVKNAPTYFGDLSFRIESPINGNEIIAEINMPDRNPPKQLLVRLRQPESRPIKSVMVNGKPWKNFDVKKEYVNIEAPSGKYIILVKY